MAKVIIALANGFEEVEALAQADLLRRVGAEVRLLAISGRYSQIIHNTYGMPRCVSARPCVPCSLRGRWM